MTMDSIISALIGAAVGFLIVLFTVRFNYKQLFAQTVSQNRMEWINSFRGEVSEIIDCLKMPFDRRKEYVYAAEKARAKLLTRLNMDLSKPGNENNKLLSDCLNGIDFSSRKSYDAEIEELLELTRKVLEHEWKRVKQEAKGKKR